MLHGSVQGETEETMEPPVLPAQQENIEREAVDMLEGITALMTGYNEVHRPLYTFLYHTFHNDSILHVASNETCLQSDKLCHIPFSHVSYLCVLDNLLYDRISSQYLFV